MDPGHEAVYKSRLESNRIEFVRKINVIAILPALASILSQSDKEFLTAQWKQQGNNAAASHLLDRLVRRDGWVEGLVNALRSEDVKLSKLANKLDPEHHIQDIPQQHNISNRERMIR